MDKVIVKDLEVYAFHGVHAEEKKMGQMFIISAEITTSFAKAVRTDDVNDTISYSAVCKEIKNIMNDAKHNLVETVAYNIIKNLMSIYPTIISVKILIKKPWAPIGKHLEYAAVEMERTREEMNEPGC
ncbi:MAG: dihydroneopterin aldolase [Saccharofermentanales bacterium]